MTHATILAAGDATRLPNKLMLQTVDAKPLIESAISFARKHAEISTIVLQSPNTPVAKYCKYYASDMEQVYQGEASGVMNAIRLGGSGLILFGDCFYSHCLDRPRLNCGSVSYTGHDELDGWSHGLWERREMCPYLKFCGWIFTDELPEGDNILEWMNKIDMMPQEIVSPVYDLGTQHSYEEHWNGDCLSKQVRHDILDTGCGSKSWRRAR